MGVLAPNSQTSGLFGYSAPYIITGGSSSSTTSFTATTTFSDNIPLVFGTDGDFEIKYKTTGTPDVGVFTSPSSSNILTFVGDGFTDYDYFNTAIAAPAPTLAFFPASSTRNRFGTINQGSSHFTLSGSDGNDLDGTARDSAGDGIFISTGNGGTLGGINDGGDLRIGLGTGAGGGIDGYIWSTNGSDADMRFKNSGTGVFRVGDSASEAALTLDHDGTDAVVSSTVGSIVLGTTKVAVGAYFSPTYSLDVFGDGRFTATGTQQLIYSNASGTNGLVGIRSYVAPSEVSMSWANFKGVIDQQVAKSGGDSSVFAGQISINGSDSGGTYRVFEAEAISATNATSVGVSVKSGYDAVFEVPVDNTGNATGAVGRIPVLVGGVVRYIRYYTD